MTLESILVWIIVGLIAGWLASALFGSGYGLVGDIVIGIVGSFLGGMIFRAFGWRAPFSGLAGIIAVAFIGAVVLIAVLRLFRLGGTHREA